jgi:hypothetical protein
VAPANVNTLALQLPAHHASSHERVLQMQLINASHERQIDLIGRTWLVIHRTAAYLQQTGLTHHAQGVLSVNHRFALSNPALVSALSKKSVSNAN